MIIEIEDGEYWWGGSVNLGHEMPYDKNATGGFDLNGGRENDQFAPLLLSSKGRYVWSEKSFQATFEGGCIRLKGQGSYETGQGYGSLKGAYLAAMKKHFPFNGRMPNALFWSAPQYNTWIELGTEQTTERIAEYARNIKSHGLQEGIFMIDEGWQEEYGVFEFNKRKIPDPGGLIEELHKMGFKVMLWVTPIAACAGTNFKKLRDQGFLVRNQKGEPALRSWWNGTSCVIDLTNPEAEQWYSGELQSLMERYGVDGFKFDAGDRYFYEDTDRIYHSLEAREVTAVFNGIGEKFEFNEYRAAWKFGGKGIVARLHDKYHTWDAFGLNTLVPHTVVQGLCGYAYGCPDMVGGGVLACFDKGQEVDRELFIRWIQASALMGMIQFSAAPWRILDREGMELVKDAVKLHISLASTFCHLARQAAQTGEPIIRHMAYEYPGEGLEKLQDQFMIGDRILAAPVLQKGAASRSVMLPGGRWRYRDGEIYAGGQRVEIPVTMQSIPYFERI